MRIAVLDGSALCGEAISRAIRGAGVADSVIWSQDARQCLPLVGTERIDVLIFRLAELSYDDKALINAATLLKAFKSVAIFGTQDRRQMEENCTADACITEGSSLEELLGIIRTMGPTVSSRRVSRANGSLPKFSVREMEVAKLVSQGYSNNDISLKTGLSSHAVKNAVHRIMSKTACDNRTQIALYLRSQPDLNLS